MLFVVELVKVRTPFRFYTIASSFDDKENLSNVDNELLFVFELVKVLTPFLFYTIASLFKDKANLSGVENEFDTEYDVSLWLNLLKFVLLFDFTRSPLRSKTKQTSVM